MPSLPPSSFGSCNRVEKKNTPSSSRFGCNTIWIYIYECSFANKVWITHMQEHHNFSLMSSALQQTERGRSLAQNIILDSTQHTSSSQYSCSLLSPFRPFHFSLSLLSLKSPCINSIQKVLLNQICIITHSRTFQLFLQ